jgi:hypothetical protein
VTSSTKTHNGVTRTTTITYLHQAGPNAAAYASRYIRNRVRTVTVTDGVQTFTPLTVQYDTAGIGQYDLPAAGLGLHDPAFFGTGSPYRGNATNVTKGNASTIVGQIDYAGLIRQSTGPEGTVTVQTSLATRHSQPSWTSLNGVGTSLSYDGLQRLSSAVGAAGDTSGFARGIWMMSPHHGRCRTARTRGSSAITRTGW